MKNKKGSMELSVGAIVVLVMAITFLSIGLVFIRGMLGKMFNRFDEQISKEGEPPKPTLSNPITLSRNPVKAKQDSVEVIKASVMNPSQEDWTNRQFIKTSNMCGKVDGICFVDKDDETGRCDTKDNAQDNDVDCDFIFFPSCEEDGKSCLISNIEGEMYCPNYNQESRDPDCSEIPGVDIFVTCDGGIMEKPFKRNLGSIQTTAYETNVILLKMKSKIPDDQYLCQIRIFAEDNEYLEDLVVKIENE